MINSKPNNSRYHQGNYIPKFKDKVIKLNTEGGVYFRSMGEQKIMIYLDNNPKIVRWGAECITVPYQLTHYEQNGDINVKSHNYYPDFYYEILLDDGTTKKVIAEYKPQKEFENVIKLQEKSMEVPEGTLKKLKNFEYDLKTGQKNLKKWETMIKFCDKKGWRFIVITEEVMKKFNM